MIFSINSQHRDFKGLGNKKMVEFLKKYGRESDLLSQPIPEASLIECVAAVSESVNFCFERDQNFTEITTKCEKKLTNILKNSASSVDFTKVLVGYDSKIDSIPHGRSPKKKHATFFGCFRVVIPVSPSILQALKIDADSNKIVPEGTRDIEMDELDVLQFMWYSADRIAILGRSPNGEQQIVLRDLTKSSNEIESLADGLGRNAIVEDLSINGLRKVGCAILKSRNRIKLLEFEVEEDEDESNFQSINSSVAEKESTELLD